MAGHDEVHVRVPVGVWHIMAGLPYLIRLAGYGIRANPGSGYSLPI